MNKQPNFLQLTEYFTQIKNVSFKQLFDEDSQRATQFSRKFSGLKLDFSKNNIDQQALNLLIELAKQSDLTAKITALFVGEKINVSENRAALHTALRSNSNEIELDGYNIMPDIHAVQMQMADFCQQIHDKKHCGYTGLPINTIVNIGIGGSDLGPVFACDALKPYRISEMKIHFVSSVDGYMLNEVLKAINPETTLFVIASKTFTTQETLTNAHSARRWFLQRVNNNQSYISKHFVALSTNLAEVEKFGISAQHMFPFWDFVGGRYSICSAIGLSIALYIGYDNFAKMLDGARAMDQHFLQTTNLTDNLPVMLALVGIWHINICNYNSLVISPYNVRLTKFPAYIQQLEMESNGKSVNLQGQTIDYQTAPIVWGDSGINAQHAYYQLIHQGTQIIPMDIILALSDKFSNSEHSDILVANAIAQAEALMCGKSYEQAYNQLIDQGITPEQAERLAKYKVFAGNRPTTMITLPEIDPYYLGMLIALYEHKVFVQGVIWNINSFDQMGVELGKQLANNVLHDIQTKDISKHDGSTVNLINDYLNYRS